MKFISSSLIFLLVTYSANVFSGSVVEQTAEEYQRYLANDFSKSQTVNVDAEDESNVELMLEEALSIGNHGGMYWASQQIANYLNNRVHILDRIDFTPLVIPYPKYDVLPVVILEDDGRRQLSQKNKVMRILGKTYFIDSDPKIVANIPTWRDYLYVDAVPPEKPHQSFGPLIKKYPDIWLKGIKDGWNTGVDLAIYTIKTRISRLSRDYIGFVRYHLIKDANMISAPIINEVYRPVSGGGDILSIEDTIVTIEVSPKLSTDRYSWKAIPQLPDVSHLFPDVIQSSFLQGLKNNNGSK